MDYSVSAHFDLELTKAVDSLQLTFQLHNLDILQASSYVPLPFAGYCFVGLLFPSLPSAPLCNVASRLSSRLDISSTVVHMLA
jgi:hypothetical protein